MGKVGRTAAVALFAVLTACSSSEKPQVGQSSRNALRTAVYGYTHLLLDGNGEAAWVGVSDRCQKQIGHDTYIATARELKSLYSGLTLTSYTINSFTPPTAKVSYTTAVKVASKSNQSWIYENGAWRWDGC